MKAVKLFALLIPLFLIATTLSGTASPAIAVQTGIGNISTNPTELAGQIARFGIGIAGGIAFLMMIYGAFQMMFSAGNPESVQKGREIFGAAIAGLVVIIFAVFILRLIGVTIFGGIAGI